MKFRTHSSTTRILTLVGLLFIFSGIHRAGADSFILASPMHYSRGGCTATLLPNGKVLVAGGWGDGQGTSTAELYDPATDTWTETGSLHVGRANNTAVMLPNGKVLVVGPEARGGGYWGSNVAELYDPETEKWTLTKPMNYSRVFSLAGLLPNGKVLVYGDNLTADLYDPTNDSWTTVTQIPKFQNPKVPTVLPNGLIYLSGEFYSTKSNLYELGGGFFNYVTGDWTTINSPEFGVYFGATFTLLLTGEFLVTGGSNRTNAALYDYISGTWTPTGSMIGDRGGYSITVLHNGKVLRSGGQKGGTRSDSAELYDPATGMWTPTTSMQGRRAGDRTVLLPNGQVLLVGGSGSLPELYTPDAVHPVLGWLYQYSPEWAWNSTMNSFYVIEFPWIYNPDFGYFYVVGDDISQGLWIYILQEGKWAWLVDSNGGWFVYPDGTFNNFLQPVP